MIKGPDGTSRRRDPRPARRHAPSPGSCCTPTSWASARCSTTCAAVSPPTGSRCARPSRSPARRSRCAPTPTRGAHGVRAGARRRPADRRPRGRGRLPRRARRRARGRACSGFCMGGMQVLKAAATGRFDRAVAFYGMIRVPDDWVGPNTREPLDTAADVCPTLAIFGGRGCVHPGRRHRGAPRCVGGPARLRDRRLPRGRPRVRARARAARRTGPTTPPTRGGASSPSCCPTDRRLSGQGLRGWRARSQRLAVEDAVAVAALDLDPAEPGEQRQRLVHALAARADEPGEVLLGHRQPELRRRRRRSRAGASRCGRARRGTPRRRAPRRCCAAGGRAGARSPTAASGCASIARAHRLVAEHERRRSPRARGRRPSAGRRRRVRARRTATPRRARRRATRDRRASG